MGRARARRIPAQLVEDEDYQLRHERVAGIGIAKAKADVCTRLPPAREGGGRASRVEEVPARAADICELAGRLLADGVELVVMEPASRRRENRDTQHQPRNGTEGPVPPDRGINRAARHQIARENGYG